MKKKQFLKSLNPGMFIIYSPLIRMFMMMIIWSSMKQKRRGRNIRRINNLDFLEKVMDKFNEHERELSDFVSLKPKHRRNSKRFMFLRCTYHD